MNKPTNTSQSWKLVQPTVLFFKDTCIVLEYIGLWIKCMIRGFLSYLVIYCFYTLTILPISLIIFFAIVQYVKSKKQILEQSKLFVFIKKNLVQK